MRRRVLATALGRTCRYGHDAWSANFSSGDRKRVSCHVCRRAKAALPKRWPGHTQDEHMLAAISMLAAKDARRNAHLTSNGQTPTPAQWDEIQECARAARAAAEAALRTAE